MSSRFNPLFTRPLTRQLTGQSVGVARGSHYSWFGSRFGIAALALGTMLASFASTGCDELSARREIQKGDKSYGQARFREAVKHYETALSKSDIQIGHHNAGLAYYRLFTPGDPSEENKKWAENSTSHFLKYLGDNPSDKRVIDLITQIWLDSDQYERAIAYWKKVLANSPNDPGVLARLADVNRAAGKYEVAIEWLKKRVAAETTDAGRMKGYTDIANVQYARLTNSGLVDADRLAVADSALVALSKATALNPDNAQLAGLTAVIFQLRALSHGASWARNVDAASQRYFNLLARKKSGALSNKKSGKSDGKSGNHSEDSSGNKSSGNKMANPDAKHPDKAEQK